VCSYQSECVFNVNIFIYIILINWANGPFTKVYTYIDRHNTFALAHNYNNINSTVYEHTLYVIIIQVWLYNLHFFLKNDLNHFYYNNSL